LIAGNRKRPAQSSALRAARWRPPTGPELGRSQLEPGNDVPDERTCSRAYTSSIFKSLWPVCSHDRMHVPTGPDYFGNEPGPHRLTTQQVKLAVVYPAAARRWTIPGSAAPDIAPGLPVLWIVGTTLALPPPNPARGLAAPHHRPPRRSWSTVWAVSVVRQQCSAVWPPRCT
jgi:hypothetical protein